MAELNFSAVPRVELHLTLKDGTELHVFAPTTAQVDELMTTTDNNASFETLLDLFARLLSRNREKITITVEDLKDKYDFDYEDSVVFLDAYIRFIQDIKARKN